MQEYLLYAADDDINVVERDFINQFTSICLSHGSICLNPTISFNDGSCKLKSTIINPDGDRIIYERTIQYNIFGKDTSYSKSMKYMQMKMIVANS